LTATTTATIATKSVKRTNIKPPSDRPGVRSYRVNCLAVIEIVSSACRAY
jgi:RNA 3'-terminal phosphate cyclase